MPSSSHHHNPKGREEEEEGINTLKFIVWGAGVGGYGFDPAGMALFNVA